MDQQEEKFRAFGRKLLYGLASASFRTRADVSYVVEPKNWSIRADGTNIARAIRREYLGFDIRVSDKPFLENSQLVHFGSQFMFQNWHSVISKKSNIVVTYFHGKKEDGSLIKGNLEYLVENQLNVSSVIVFSFNQMRKRLVDYGLNPNLITKIPVGVSTKIFTPIVNDNQKTSIRGKLKIPGNRFVIGSFQKDGEGWGKGDEPKWIKGPDILVESLKEINNSVPIHVLLSGPSRGYVINRLEKAGISFSHYFPKSIHEMVNLYRALDLYLITSREEGGPKGLVESLSSGCPVVSTPVGMAMDLEFRESPMRITETFDSSELAREVTVILTRTKTDSETIKLRQLAIPFDWKNVGQLHFEKVYSPLLMEKFSK